MGYAYAQMLLEEKHNGQVYNLVGDPITQMELAKLINQVYQTKLSYETVSVAAFEQEEKEELGAFIGTVIAGIYEGISLGAYDIESDFEQAAGRPHKSPLEMIEAVKTGE